jgi:solute carrier family 6 GABA transporter-like protein 6/8/11/12/13
MIKVWVNALAQAFMSMGIAYGCLMAFASYNRFHNPLIRDALCLSLLNSLTSLIAGIIVFAALGHTALVQGLPIDQAATDGKGPLDSPSIMITYSWRHLDRTLFLAFNWDHSVSNRFAI